MTDTAAVFLAFVAALALVVMIVAAWRLPARVATRIAIGLALWLACVGSLSYSGLISDPMRRPPTILFVVGPVFLFVMFAVVRSGSVGRLALAAPLWMLIGLQSYRVGVELLLHRLWIEGIVPRMLTFDGANVDIWIGASAPIAAFLSTRGKGGLIAARVWNVSGLLALANVVVRSALTAPGPLHLLDSEVVNRAVGTFPYTFIAAFLAPLAIVLHVLALRSISRRLKKDVAREAAASIELPFQGVNDAPIQRCGPRALRGGDRESGSTAR